MKNPIVEENEKRVKIMNELQAEEVNEKTNEKKNN